MVGPKARLNIEKIFNIVNYIYIDHYYFIQLILGENNTIKLLEANEKPLIPSIRVNTLKIPVGKLKERLESKDFKLSPIEEIPYGFEVLESKLSGQTTY